MSEQKPPAKWEPWAYTDETRDRIAVYKAMIAAAKAATDQALSLPIPEPPCKHCQNWRPAIELSTDGGFGGVALCRSDEMYNDFSCFEARADAN